MLPYYRSCHMVYSWHDRKWHGVTSDVRRAACDVRRVRYGT